MKRRIGFVVGILLAAVPAFAVDGVIEINQARALAGGVVATDTAGFPVTINESGSYRLTSNLTVPQTDPANTSAIVVQTNNVTIDLNGFTLQGPSNCAGGPITCTPSGSSRGIDGSGRSGIRVVNGVLRGFPGGGILIGQRSRVESVRAEVNGSDCINVTSASVVKGCVASTCAGNGIVGGSSTTISDSTSTNNGQVGIRSGNGSVITGCTAADNGLDGLYGDDGSTISNSTSFSNDGNGIFGGIGSLVTGNSVTNNTGSGLLFESNTAAYSNNVISNNNGGNQFSQVAGGLKLGNNACGTILCP